MQLITRELFTEVLEKARRSPRRRMNHNFHSGDAELAHRFLNVLLHGTYIRPHRHLDPPKSEAFLVLEGEVFFLLFDDAGKIVRRELLGPDASFGVDIQPGVWHTVAALSPHAVCYEVKTGPYAPMADKEFAPWAPREGEAGVAAYLDSLLGASARP